MEWNQSLQGQRAAFAWFTQSQLHSVIRNGIVPEWFHGIISRKTAEELLMSKPPGYFLIRVSESRIGYTLSYRAEDRYRHFMIDVLDDGHYILVGENRPHRFLQDLVDFHRRNPIIPFNEVLTVACGQTSDDKTDYAELLFPQRHLNHNASLPPNNFLLLPGVSNPDTEEDIPPALPYRPNNLRNSAVLSPDSRPNSLYPSLEEDFPRATSPLPATPVLMTRNRYVADNPQQPPQVPARTPGPPPKQNPSTPANENPICTNFQPVKNQEAKPSVVTNLKNLRKKLQKRASMLQESMYTEINMVTNEKSGDAENEYHEITVEQTLNPPKCSYTGTNVTDGGLPREYLPPPPFAPGY